MKQNTLTEEQVKQFYKELENKIENHLPKGHDYLIIVANSDPEGDQSHSGFTSNNHNIAELMCWISAFQHQLCVMSAQQIHSFREQIANLAQTGRTETPGINSECNKIIVPPSFNG